MIRRKPPWDGTATVVVSWARMTPATALEIDVPMARIRVFRLFAAAVSDTVIASTIAGLLYTVASPAVAFGHVAACMALALAALARAAKPTPFVSAQSDR